MADEQLVPGTGEDRVDSKRKCEDFAALYTLDTTHSSVAVSRGINDHTGKSSTSSHANYHTKFQRHSVRRFSLNNITRMCRHLISCL